MGVDEAGEQGGDGPGFLGIGGNEGDLASGGNLQIEFIEELFFGIGMDVGDAFEFQKSRQGSEELRSHHLPDGGDLIEVALNFGGDFLSFRFGDPSFPEGFEGEVEPGKDCHEDDGGAEGEMFGSQEDLYGDEVENQTGTEDHEQFAAPADEALMAEDAIHEGVVATEVFLEAIAGVVFDVKPGGESSFLEAFGEELEFAAGAIECEALDMIGPLPIPDVEIPAGSEGDEALDGQNGMHDQQQEEHDGQFDGGGSERFEATKNDIPETIHIGGEQLQDAVILLGFPGAGSEPHRLAVNGGANAVGDLGGSQSSLMLSERVNGPAERHQDHRGRAEHEQAGGSVFGTGDAEVEEPHESSPGLLARMPDGGKEALITEDQLRFALDAETDGSVGFGSGEAFHFCGSGFGKEEILTGGEEIGEEEEVEKDQGKEEGADRGPDDGFAAESAPEFSSGKELLQGIRGRYRHSGYRCRNEIEFVRDPSDVLNGSVSFILNESRPESTGFRD